MTISFTMLKTICVFYKYTWLKLYFSKFWTTHCYFLSLVQSLFLLSYFVVLTQKYLGLFFNFQMFCISPPATNSAHLLKIYSSVFKGKFIFHLDNQSVAWKSVSFWKQLWYEPFYYCQPPFFLKFQNLKCMFLRWAFQRKNDFFHNNRFLPLGGLQSISYKKIFEIYQILKCVNGRWHFVRVHKLRLAATKFAHLRNSNY